MACPRAARFGWSLVLLLLIPSLLRTAEPASADAVRARAVAALYDGVREETLPNGLRIYLKPIPEAPTVTIMTVYKVGSADEELAQTGLSHYLEHLMFKGTEKLKPGDIDKLTRRAGGHNNAYTTNDFTNFHFDIAADRWMVALEIEADRMRNLRIDEAHEFEQEKGAVIAELEGNEDEPWELEGKALAPLLFGDKTPYGHPIIGERAHVKNATAAIIKSHYDKWYHPNNASLIVVGGFDTDKALARIKELFNPIPASKLPARIQVAPVERAKPVEKTIASKFELDRFIMGFNTVKVGDPEDYTLDVVEHLLSNGKTGRLYRRLVLEKEVAGEVTCSNQTGRFPGWFSIQLEVMKGTDPKKAEKALLEELRKLADDPITAEELTRVKRGILANMIFGQEGVHELADSIANAVAQSNLDYRRTYSARLQAVTAKDIQTAARKYLDPNKRAVVFSKPEKKDKDARRPTAPEKSAAPRRGRETTKPALARVDLTKAKRTVLPNGLTLLLLENRRLPIVYAEAHVKKVRLYEPEAKAGLAMLVGSLLEEGTDRHDEKEIAHLIEDVGGILAMSGSGGHVKVLTPDRALGLSLLLECLTRPAFPKASVKRLKEHLLSEIEDADQQPGTRALEAFHERVFGDHPLGRPVHGTEAAVEKLTAEDCENFHKKVFVPNNTILTVVGDFDADAMVKEIANLTQNWKKRDLPGLKLPEVKLPDKFVQKVLPMESAA